MLKDKRVLAVIPARKGSKRLPNKNMLMFHGQPLIARTINSAISSKYIDKVVVSSDSKQILDFSNKLGAFCHDRPEDLAKDDSSSIDLALDLLKNIKGYDILVWLQPTSPLRCSIDIDLALDFYIEKNAESVVSVCEASHSPLWMSAVDKYGKFSGFRSLDAANKRSQDLKIFYQLNGAIYISDVNSLVCNKAFLTRDSYAYTMSREKSIDIDTKLDFKIAEVIYSELKS